MNRYSYVNIILILIGLVWTSRTVHCEEPPRRPSIADDTIRFANGRNLQIPTHVRLHGDPLQALRLKEPVSVDIEATIVDPWHRVIVVRTEELFEGERKVLSILNWEGDQIGPLISFVGTDYILAQSSRILLAQQSSQVIVRESVLIDPDANKIAEIKQPEFVREFGVSADQKLFWIVSNPVSETGPLTRVEVYDMDGRAVDSIESRSARLWKITKGGIEYEINVPTPDWPG